MGGHGGLNILPQKRWNVYNYENREKVRQDEEAAAKEEQLKREQARKRDAEFRLEQLRAARGLAPLKKTAEPVKEAVTEYVGSEPKAATEYVGSQPRAATEHVESEPKLNHINLFEGIKIFDPIKGSENGSVEKDGFKKKKMKKEEVMSNKVVTPDDEKYRLGYGVAGKGVKLPWYLERKNNCDVDDEKDIDDGLRVQKEGKKGEKKTLQELREERLRREQKEKERERALIMGKSRKERIFSEDRRFSRR